MMTHLEKTISAPRSPFLVFTSAGDRSNVHLWCKRPRGYDLWVVYYGDRTFQHRQDADYYLERDGAKFANLHHCYEQFRDLLSQYRAIMVMDDDVIISPRHIERLFHLRDEYDLWVLQPAFRARGKISHSITRVYPLSFFRHVNFVETTCPLFRRDKLDEFMQVYDPSLVAWGVDWWYMAALGDVRGRAAVVDSISCVNPRDQEKPGGVREVNRLHVDVESRSHWEAVKARHHIELEERLIDFKTGPSRIAWKERLRSWATWQRDRLHLHPRVPEPLRSVL